jgi:hypothetical protein
MMLTQKDLQEVIDYSPSTGLFSWSKKRRGVVVGKPLGCDNGFGYLRITVLGRSYYAHRLAWLYMHGEWPETIDHINGNKSDNRISNLRSCTTASNNQNIHGPQANSKTQTLGVSWHKKAKKWQAHICIYKKRKYLGLFTTIEAAHNAYMKERSNVCL